MNPSGGLPFSAVVGQEDAKLALLLCAVERRIGGVLLRGAKGSAKSTLARGLAALLPGEAPFVELPIGATEDRVIGTLDIGEALTGGTKRFEPGLLATADGGVLYVDEINLLPDHLVDVLLDVAASGVNRVEREGISHSHTSRFLLIGSMNPEEGELRPQLLDRFGLTVEVRTALGDERAAALRRRLDLDDSPSDVARRFASSEAELAARLVDAIPARLPDDLIVAVAALCAGVEAEGLRGDLAICRAASALAGWEGRDTAGPADVRRVAAMALAHRARRDPFDPVGVDADRLDEAMDEHLDPPDEGGAPADDPDPGSGPPSPVDQPPSDQAPGHAEPAEGPPVDGPERRAPPLTSAGRSQLSQAAPGRRAIGESIRGRLVGDRAPNGPVASVALGATVRRAVQRRAGTDGPPAGPLVHTDDLREAVRRQKTANLVVVAVDASGSMGAERRMQAAKGAVMGLLRDAYQRRDLVGLVSFRGEGAEVLLRPTGSVEVARARLSDLPTGGRTPLAAGIEAAIEMARAPSRVATHTPVMVLVTDGRATSGPAGRNPLDAAKVAAGEVARLGLKAVVIDVEGFDGGPRLGLAAELADRMGAIYVAVPELTSDAIAEAVTVAGVGRR